jgi:hypothetical protein
MRCRHPARPTKRTKRSQTPGSWTHEDGASSLLGESKVVPRSMSDLNPGISRYLDCTFEKRGGLAQKAASISIAYEVRTKSAQSGALENNGRRERILGPSSPILVRRFAREGPYLLGRFCGLASRRRMLGAKRLAGEMGFGLPVRNRVSTLVISMTYARRICAGERCSPRSIDHQRHCSAHQSAEVSGGTSAPGGKPDMLPSFPYFRFWTHNGHRPASHAAVAKWVSAPIKTLD